jgi:hypothetical protein
MNDQFNTWWDSSELLKDNPYRKDSPAYWAWEGWCAAVLAEREECAKLCETEIRDLYASSNKSSQAKIMLYTAADDCAAAIRARGQE